jgi:transcription elongation factor Elf1
MAPEYELEDDDAQKAEAIAGSNTRFKEFDCPSCNANNPADPPFGDGEEVLCNYCGQEYRVKVSEEGRLKLKEI